MQGKAIFSVFPFRSLVRLNPQRTVHTFRFFQRQNFRHALFLQHMRLFRILLILCFPLPVFSQYLDSLGEVLRGKASIDLRFESRWSLASNQLITISGIRIGAAYEKKLRLGGGINWLKTPLSRIDPGINESGQAVLVTTYFKLGYVSAYADMVFHKTKRWQLSVPIQVGAGYSWLQDHPQYDFKGMNSAQFLFLYEPGITVQFKVFRWFGLGSDIAYRFAIQENKKVSEQLNSPTLSLKVLFWLDQLYFMLAPESALSQRYGPSAW